jgi:hypothetical protein
MSRWGASLLLILTPLLAVRVPRAVAADDVNTLQARFDREGNSIHKAKLLEKLGDAQLELTRRASRANDYKTIGLVMEKYRDNARIAVDSLKKDRRDAEHHTNGYKQLQIHVHKSLRELDEVLVLAPDEYRPPLELVRRDLANMDDELLELLFPRHPNTKKPVEKSSAGTGVSP